MKPHIKSALFMLKVTKLFSADSAIIYMPGFELVYMDLYS